MPAKKPNNIELARNLLEIGVNASRDLVCKNLSGTEPLPHSSAESELYGNLDFMIRYNRPQEDVKPCTECDPNDECNCFEHDPQHEQEAIRIMDRLREVQPCTEKDVYGACKICHSLIQILVLMHDREQHGNHKLVGQWRETIFQVAHKVIRLSVVLDERAALHTSITQMGIKYLSPNYRANMRNTFGIEAHHIDIMCKEHYALKQDYNHAQASLKIIREAI